MSLLLALALTLSAAAGAREDLAAASDAGADDPTRQAAFDRIVALGSTDMSVIAEVSSDPDADARQRWVATRAMGKVGGPRAREALMSLLVDEMPAMRAAAAGALGDTRDPGVVAPLCEALGDPAVIVRAAAAEALGKLGSPDAVGPLSAALDSRDSFYRGSSLWVRAHYATALGRIRDKRAVPALLRGLDDADEGVVVASVTALESIAGFTFSQGRSESEEREAWRRWAAAQIAGG